MTPRETDQRDEIVPRGPRTGAIVRRLLRYARPHAGLVTLTALCALAGVGLSLWVPVLIGDAVDALVGAGDVDWEFLAWSVRTIALVALGVAAFQWAQGYASNRLSYETVRDLRNAAYDKLHRLPVSYLDTHGAGDLISRIVNDADAVGDGILQGVQQLLTGIVTIVGTLLFMLTVSPEMTVVVVLLTPISMLGAWAIAHFSQKTFAAQQQIQGRLSAYTEEHVGVQRLLNLYGRQVEERDGFGAINGELYQVGERAQFIGSLTNPGTRFVNNLVYAGVAAAGCCCVVTGIPGTLTVGGVQSFLSYATQYTKPFNEISGVLAQVQTALAGAERLFGLIDAPEQEPDAPDARALPEQARGEVAFRGVTFGYDPKKPVLHNVSWHASPGERIAVVGPTGCGKTTLINLLLRFYDVDEGAVLVDGADVRSLKRASLRGAFGMVLQDTWLFEGTVRENIAYGCPAATDEQVQEAARRAFADGFIEQLPNGYDTVIGGASTQLSQGQCQLLCIARVMLRDPSVLVLDEATSSIDTRTEVLVQAAFDAMVAGRTSIIVAHRLSTIRHATRILAMKDGHIVEQGTHEELLAAGGLYAQLYRAQWAQEEAEASATE